MSIVDHLATEGQKTHHYLRTIQVSRDADMIVDWQQQEVLVKIDYRQSSFRDSFCYFHT
jgi:hypothetical protein